MITKKLLILRYHNRLLAMFMNDKRLADLRVYDESRASRIGNIYVGKVQNVAENIGAAFVRTEGEEIGFLPLENAKKFRVFNRKYDGMLHAGDELLVQVERDPGGKKQPLLSGNISLSGIYLALADDGRKFGVSGKLEQAKKNEITSFLRRFGVVDEHKKCLPMYGLSFSMVVRTNAGKLTDLAPLLAEWKSLSTEFKQILETAKHRLSASCVYRQNDPLIDDLKNYPMSEFEEIVTDQEDMYEALRAYYDGFDEMAPRPKLSFYQDEYPLSKLYSVKTQLERALCRQVWLKSGGYLVFDSTEALTAIDVNSGKCEQGDHTEDTFLKINKEAAEEIARQLKLRNLSGIIIVDFISMESEDRQQELLGYMRSLVRSDQIKTSVVDITPLGLVEITRKRVSRPLKDMWNEFDNKGGKEE